MKIRRAQNVGRVIISRGKTTDHVGANFNNFAMGPKTYVWDVLHYFLLWANRQPLLLSTLGGQMGTPGIADFL